MGTDMGRIDTRKWLAAWVDENLVDPRWRRDRSAMAREGAACLAAAAAMGIDEAELTAACGGDLLQFLFEQQAVLVDERKRSHQDEDFYL